MAYEKVMLSWSHFHFRDCLAEKTRPAVVISNDSMSASGDLLVAAITSQPCFAISVTLGDTEPDPIPPTRPAALLLLSPQGDRT